MTVYAEVGSSLQQIGGDCPDGWVVMKAERPSSEHTAGMDGTWILSKPIVDLKLIGVEFEGVMCSATKEDMWGLSSVVPWIESGNSTAFEFDNGSVLVLTPENYRAFYEVWASFRASFFNKVE
ncbi:hypothetical protein [Sphingobium sp. CFD-1]|uniref:hypothetical protein n=1 Tax=Sphingobium sp. CFD-1 TaxID=2878545 RepID=UPI00214B7431|nr:hypothetical protein [Sphingobium sp. CFD-1]